MKFALLAAIALAGCTTDIESATETQPLSSDWVHMQIVAHEDDDILFMNPDLQESIAAGHRVVTVYMTAGQASGAGENQEQCAAEFANQRQIAAKTAFATMAFPNYAYPSTLPWTRELIVPDAGTTWPHTVERYTLQANPNLVLIFMNLPDAGSAIGNCAYPMTVTPPNIPFTNALIDLTDDPNGQVNTIVPDCGPIQGFSQTQYCAASSGDIYGGNDPDGFACNSFEGCSPTVPLQNYSQADVISVLGALVNEYQPIVVRTLDPNPFSFPGYIDYDNSDHIAAARFTDKILANYHGPYGTARYSVEYYKGYPFYAYPQNLGTQDRSTKQSVAFEYANFDLNYTNFISNYDSWYGLLYDRYPASSQWLQRSSDGRLVAVTVEDRQLQLYYENTPGGSWTGPVPLNAPGGPFAPNVSLLKRSDGKLQIVAMSLPLARETWSFIPVGTPGQDIRTVVQDDGAISFTNWIDIGAPWMSTGTPLAGTGSASSTLNSNYVAANAFDGNANTSWAPGRATSAYLQDDLSQNQVVTNVSMSWTIGSSSQCTVAASPDATTWTTIGTVSGPYSGRSNFIRVNQTARYVRAACRIKPLVVGFVSASVAEMIVDTATTGQLNGVPAMAIDGSGRQFVFARNSEGYIWYTYDTSGVWQPWQIVDGLAQDISDDGISAITADDGSVEIVAMSRSGNVLHYRQSGTAFTSVAINVQAANLPTISKNQDGRLEIFYREITDPNDSSKYGRVVTAWQNTSGQWMGGADNLGLLYGDAGRGPVAAIRRESSGHMMLFERNVFGGISATWQSAVNGSWYDQWDLLGAPSSTGMVTEFPTAATDGLGRAAVVVKDTSGRLFMNRESSSDSIGSFTGWVQIGN